MSIMLWVKGNSPWRISVHNLFKISFKNFGFENTNLIGRLRLFLLLIHWLVVQTVKNLPAMWETWVQSLSLEYSMENKWQPTQILFPGELHGQRSLADYSPWGQKKLDTTEWLTLTEYKKAFDCVDHNKLWKIVQEMGIPDHLTCLLRDLYVG